MSHSFFYLLPCLLLSLSCTSQKEPESIPESPKKDTISLVERYYLDNNQVGSASESNGSVSDGSLLNGKLLPFSGRNFTYFDTSSYLNGRAYLHEKVLSALLDCYDTLYQLHPERKFTVMECSAKEGGKLPPHRTHQNGLSVDLMVPLLRDGQPTYELDHSGASHYLLSFDDKGRYTVDSSVIIDFNLIGQHISLLNDAAHKYGLKIAKVIFKMELKDELFTSDFGPVILEKGIYITRNLSPLINSLHDDHFHVDFEPL